MKRRIISIISVLTIVCSLFQVPILAAKTTVDESKLSVLESLNIIDGELPTRVTYDIFVKALMKYVLEDDERAIYTPETFAKSVGMIGAGDEYSGNAVISLEEVIKYGVTLLGYDNNILPNINYKSIARQENLLKGVSTGNTFKPADMVAFLYNLLEAEPLSIESLGDGGMIYNTSGKHTLLSMYRDIYECNGIITADEDTSIYSEKGAGENSISIDKYTFIIDCEYDKALLGCDVIAYVKDDGENEPSVIYIKERENRNKKLTVWDKDILSVNDSYTVIEYEDERGKREKVKIDQHPKVIINGVFYGDYKKADLMPENGYIEFIDNDKDDKYEILNVKAYQTIIVDSVNVDKEIIDNEFDFAPGVTLRDVKYTIKKAGETIELREIVPGDALSVAMSRGSGEKVCEILVSSDSKEFTVSRINLSDRKLYEGNNLYLISADFIEYLEDEGKKIRIGSTYDFVLDAFGRIVYCKTVSDDDYALFFRAYPDTKYDIEYIRYLDTDGNWKEAKLAKRVMLDAKTQEPGETYEALKVMDPQVIKIRLNSDGYVKEIRTATEYTLNDAKYIEDGFTKTKEATYTYIQYPSTFENVLYMKKGAKIFVTPKDVADRYNKEKYYVADATSYFKEGEFSVSVYDVDRFGYSGLYTTKGGNESTRMSDDVFVVTGITEVLDSYGDARSRLEGCGGGYKDISFLTKDTTVLKNEKGEYKIQKGDVINFILDNKGHISQVSSPIVRLQDEFAKHNSGSDKFYYKLRNIRATIEEIDFEDGRIILDYGTGEIAFPFSSSINCMEYNTATQECDLINYDSFRKTDKVMVITEHYAIRDMIRICE